MKNKTQNNREKKNQDNHFRFYLNSTKIAFHIYRISVDAKPPAHGFSAVQPQYLTATAEGSYCTCNIVIIHYLQYSEASTEPCSEGGALSFRQNSYFRHTHLQLTLETNYYNNYLL